MADAPLDLPTPPAVDGVHDLSAVVEAAREAAGYPSEPPDDGVWWQSAAQERDRRHRQFLALLADWHGLPADACGLYRPTETVALVDGPRVRVEAHLVVDGRGLWLADVRIRHRSGTIPDCLGPASDAAYADRATALRHSARHALSEFNGGPYRRIIADLTRWAANPLEA